MGRAIAKIAEIFTPKSLKTTFTLGPVGGGTSVNTIAPDAGMALDSRSNEMAPLLATQMQVLAAVRSAVTGENARWGVNTLSVEAAVRANTAFSGKPGGFHALSEWVDLTDAWKGAQTSLVTVLGLLGVQGVSEPLLEKRPPRTR